MRDFSLTNTAEIGDMITIDGYGKKLFEVESIMYEREESKEYIADSIIYEAIDLETFEYMLAFQEDIAVVERADDAKEALEGRNPYEDIASDGLFNWSEIMGFAAWTGGNKQPYYLTPPRRAVSDYDRIDELLIELSDYQTLINMPGGSDELSAEHERRIGVIKAELRRLSEGEAGK